MPIPIAYDEKGNFVPVPKEQLPIKLPEKINLKTKGNPLDHQNEWKKITINGKKYNLETDTLDTFVDSSWYYLRFCSPKNMTYGYDLDELNIDAIDQYVSGIEHDITFIIFTFLCSLKIR